MNKTLSAASSWPLKVPMIGSLTVQPDGLGAVQLVYSSLPSENLPLSSGWIVNVPFLQLTTAGFPPIELFRVAVSSGMPKIVGVPPKVVDKVIALAFSPLAVPNWLQNKFV